MFGIEREYEIDQNKMVFNKKFDQEISMLILSIEDGCLAHVIGKKKPNDAWELLEKMFKFRTGASIDVLLTQYQ